MDRPWLVRAIIDGISDFCFVLMSLLASVGATVSALRHRRSRCGDKARPQAGGPLQQSLLGLDYLAGKP